MFAVYIQCLLIIDAFGILSIYLILVSLLNCFPRDCVCPLYERDESVRVHSAGLSHDQTGDVGAGRGKSSPSQEGDLP